MTTRRLQKSQVGFHFTLGSRYEEDGDYSNDWLYFKSCQPEIQAALFALPSWKQTEEEANDVMQVAPYELCEMNCEMNAFNEEMTWSVWVESQRISLFPKDHVVAMRDAISAAMTAKFVRAQTYLEYTETGFTELDL